MKRTFIAFDINPAPVILAAFEEIRHKLRLEKISWVPSDRFHMTIKFLGDTPDECIPEIAGALKETIGRFNVFMIRLAGIGVFKNIHDPRVIWMGCKYDAILEELKKLTEKTVTDWGFKPEERRFSPHLTLGRIREIRQVNQLSEVIARFKDTTFQEDQISEIVFYESLLKPSGPVYTPLQKFGLL